MCHTCILRDFLENLRQLEEGPPPSPLQQLIATPEGAKDLNRASYSAQNAPNWWTGQGGDPNKICPKTSGLGITVLTTCPE